MTALLDAGLLLGTGCALRLVALGLARVLPKPKPDECDELTGR